jgi:nucleotide-binding universal stress UspA family protein
MNQTTPRNEQLREAVLDALRWLPSVNSTGIHVVVDGGCATLSGEVGTYQETLQAAKAALKIGGITAVAQEIMVRGSSPASADHAEGAHQAAVEDSTVKDKGKLVVVGIDGSEGSLAALRWALKEAALLNAAVEVVHCYLPQTLTDFGFGTPHELHTASVIMVQNEVEAALGEMSEQPPVRRSSLTGGPAKTLLARADGASILVLGAHGRTALRDLVLGRVGQACIRHAPCPVAIVGVDHSVVRHETPSAAAAVG